MLPIELRNLIIESLSTAQWNELQRDYNHGKRAMANGFIGFTAMTDKQLVSHLQYYSGKGVYDCGQHLNSVAHFFILGDDSVG